MQRIIYFKPFKVTNQDFKFQVIFSQKLGTPKLSSRTHIANDFFSWEHLEIDLGVLSEHFETGLAEYWGGAVKVVVGTGLNTMKFKKNINLKLIQNWTIRK